MSKHLEPAVDAAHAPWWRDFHKWFPYAFLGLMLVFSSICGVVATRMVQTKNYNLVTAVSSFVVPEPETVFGKSRIIVALLGLDYDYTDKDIEFSTNARTDKISVYALDFPTKVVKEIAVPRDMEAIVAGHENKINAAYATGGEKMTDRVVGEFLGLAKNDKGRYFDRFITLRIDATKDFIDAIGGIDVKVDEEMNYDDSWGHLHIHFHPGLQHMNGDQAVSFARFRHDACSDPCRIRRQQLVTRLAIKKLKDEKFNDIAHIAQLIGVVNRNVVTNLSGDEMRSLAWHFRDINLADVKSEQVAYVDDKSTVNGDVLIPDEKQKAHIVADFIGPYTASTPPPAPGVAASIAPASVHVAVENGSGVAGLGKRMAEELKKQGFVIASVSNADASTYETTVIKEHSKVAGVGERVRSGLALKTAAVTPAPSAAATASTAPEIADVTVIVGRDFATAAVSTSATPQ